MVSWSLWALELRFRAVLRLLGCGLLVLGCEPSTKRSIERARQHVPHLVAVTAADVGELRTGLPRGAELLAKRLGSRQLGADPEVARRALSYARGKVQDLRVAKATFFAVTKPDGTVVRNDQELDQMAGKSLLTAFKGLAGARAKYVEVRGSMPEASGVRGRPDGQWLAAVPVKTGAQVRGLYVAGWSWSSYAYRLENALKSRIIEEITRDKGSHAEQLPLFYVVVVVDKEVYGKPIIPVVNLEAVRQRAPMSKLQQGVFSTALEIDGRDFGLVVQAAPALGAQVGVGILRSEI